MAWDDGIAFIIVSALHEPGCHPTCMSRDHKQPDIGLLRRTCEQASSMTGTIEQALAETGDATPFLVQGIGKCKGNC